MLKTAVKSGAFRAAFQFSPRNFAGVLLCAVLSGCGGGGGGGGPTTAMKICADGNRIPEADICMKNCNGGRIPETDDCPRASRIPPGPYFCDLDNIMGCREYTENYGLTNIRAASAYREDAFGQGVTVAVIDTGIHVTHESLRANIVPGRDFAETFRGTVISDAAKDTGHGTGVAAVVAAAANRGRLHGVAPQAKLMPLKVVSVTGDFGNFAQLSHAYNHAVNMDVPIVNNSYGTPYNQTGTSGGGRKWWAEVPFIRDYRNPRVEEDTRHIRTVFDGGDIVMVWAAGNEGWNEINGQVLFCFAEANCLSNNRNRITREEFFNMYPSSLRTSHPPNVTNPESRYPIYAASHANFSAYRNSNGDNINILMEDNNSRILLDRWLSVVAVDLNNQIAPFSNGCGDAKWWCLAAPGVDIITAGKQRDNQYIRTPGTSVAAPHVSGALAVLKSAAPSMPMSMIRMVLLTTATDLGAPDVDDVYGYGLVNLEKAVNEINRAAMMASSAAGVPIKSAGVRLPHALAHLKPRLKSAHAAVSVAGLYYNAPLSDFTNVAPAPELRLADTAKDMLAPADAGRFESGAVFAATDSETNRFRYAGADIDALGGWRFRRDFCNNCKTPAHEMWDNTNAAPPLFAAKGNSTALHMKGEGLRPFAAAGGGNSPWRQFGIRWHKEYARIGVLAEASRVSENNTVMGADFGALGRGGAKSNQGRFMLRGKLTDGLRGFAEYQSAHGAANIRPGGLLSEVSGLRAESWAAGFEFADIFRGGDRLRFSARQDFGFTGGGATLRRTVAEGDALRAFYAGGKNPQTLREKESRLNLAGGAPPPVLNLGYAARLQNGGEIALGAAHAGNRGAALSAHFRIAF